MTEHGLQQDIRRKFITSVQEEFLELLRALVADDATIAVGLHLDKLKTLHDSLMEIKSNRSCLCCLMRMPEKVLSCGHAICDICTKAVGNPSISEKYTFTLSGCPLCGTVDNAANIQLHPSHSRYQNSKFRWRRRTRSSRASHPSTDLLTVFTPWRPSLRLL